MNVNDLYAAACEGGRSHEKQLFEQLSVRFSLIAHLKIGNREDAEEVVQEALATIAREYKNMEFRSFRAWAYKVFDNRLLTYIGAKIRSRANPTVTIDEALVMSGNPNPSLDFKLGLMKCLDKVRTANARYARILNLSYQGYSTGEICDRLRVTKENMYMILSRARALLKSCLDTGEVSS